MCCCTPNMLGERVCRGFRPVNRMPHGRPALVQAPARAVAGGAEKLDYICELASCKTLGFSHRPATTAAPVAENAKPTQNDPHNLRRLRRPTGPHRAALC